MLVTIMQVVLALSLVALNGFFVLAEFAIVKVRRTKLEELANQNVSGAKVALIISKSLDSYLSAIQLGITLASLALGWLGQPAIAIILKPLFKALFNDNPVLQQSISLAVAFSIITLLHVVLGELVPKSVAIQASEKMALAIAWPLFIFHKLSYPFVYVFDKIAALTLKIIGMAQNNPGDLTHSEEELKMIVNASNKEGVLNETDGKILYNVFSFSDKRAHEVMIPRPDMVCLYIENSYEENKKIMLKSIYTRFPLCHESKDNILGMVHLRDMLENEMKASKTEDLQKLKREVLFVPETLNLRSIMQLMQKKRIHMAVVVDEYGGTAGLISLEDIIEELVGEIQDEYDHEETEVTKLPDGSYLISGLLTQAEVEKLLDTNLGDQDDETIGGVIFSALGRKPEVGDIVTISKFLFEIAAVEHLRIDKLIVKPINKSKNKEKGTLEQ